MRMPLLASLALAFGLVAVTCFAAEPPNPEIVSLGNSTYALTRWANNGFVRHTEGLKKEALQEAAAFCAAHGKKLKVVSVTTKHPFIPLTGFAHAKVVFMALDANSPELRAPAAASTTGLEVPVTAEPAPAPQAAPPDATDRLYNDLLKLNDLRKRGILTEKEFETQKEKLLKESK